MKTCDEIVMEALRKELPEIQVKSIQEKLELADTLKDREAELTETVKRLTGRIKELESQLGDIVKRETAVNSMETALVNREKVVYSRERDLDTAILKSQLKDETERNNDLFKLVETIFRSDRAVSTSGFLSVRSGNGSIGNLPFQQTVQEVRNSEIPEHHHDIGNGALTGGTYDTRGDMR